MSEERTVGEGAGTGRHGCPECGRQFAAPQGLGAHRARKHGFRRAAASGPSVRRKRSVGRRAPERSNDLRALVREIEQSIEAMVAEVLEAMEGLVRIRAKFREARAAYIKAIGEMRREEQLGKAGSG